MILVTGGTGLVGANLLFQLTQTEEKVNAIYRNEKKREHVLSFFQSLSDNGSTLFDKIQWHKADINDVPALEKAFKDVDYVYHAAGFISFSPNDFDKLCKINIEGTANIVNLCVAYNIKKLCHVSSIAALSHSYGKVTDESSTWNPEAKNNDYAISKHGGEMEVWRGSQEGLSVVVINPSVILGNGFWISGSGRMVKKIAEGIAYYPTGGTGFVAVWDVVNAMILLMNSEVENERFILNGFNATYSDISKTIAKQINSKVPTKKIGFSLLNILAKIDGLLSFLRLKKRQLSTETAVSLSRISEYDGSKITSTIDFSYTDKETALKKVCEYWISHKTAK